MTKEQIKEVLLKEYNVLENCITLYLDCKEKANTQEKKNEYDELAKKEFANQIELIRIARKLGVDIL